MLVMMMTMTVVGDGDVGSDYVDAKYSDVIVGGGGSVSDKDERNS